MATGAAWRRDGVGRSRQAPLKGLEQAHVLTPDDLMAGTEASGPVVLYDDDHYYMGGVLAELLAKEGFAVSVVTPAAEVSTWMRMTMEQFFVQQRLVNMGVRIVSHHSLAGAAGAQVTIACGFTNREMVIDDCSVVTVTARLPHTALQRELMSRRDDWQAAGIRSVTLIGDALAPGSDAGVGSFLLVHQGPTAAAGDGESERSISWRGIQ